MSITKKSSNFLNRGLLLPIVLLGIIIIWIGIRVISPGTPSIFSGTQPDHLGVTEGKLTLCPNRPNCVSSQAQDQEHFIEPFSYQGSSPEAIANLKQIINAQDGTKIMAEGDQYLYAEFASRWMGFVDDVEFYVNEGKGIIEVRSASRLGESDLGVNRQRIEQIRQELRGL